jgi:hypothetical protein
VRAKEHAVCPCYFFDNEGAKMKTSKDVIQKYNGVSMVDNKQQIIVATEAFGEGQEDVL